MWAEEKNKRKKQREERKMGAREFGKAEKRKRQEGGEGRKKER